MPTSNCKFLKLEYRFGVAFGLKRHKKSCKKLPLALGAFVLWSTITYQIQREQNLISDVATSGHVFRYTSKLLKALIVMRSKCVKYMPLAGCGTAQPMQLESLASRPRDLPTSFIMSWFDCLDKRTRKVHIDYWHWRQRCQTWCNCTTLRKRLHACGDNVHILWSHALG